MNPDPRSLLDRMAQDLYDQPGHLIRRAHQISSAMFVNVVSADITPIQYAILRMVHERPGIDQVGLARSIGVDTSTAAMTAARLEKKELLTRRFPETNRRQLRLELTPAGEKLIDDLVASVHRMRRTLLGSLSEPEQVQLMTLLRKFVMLNNGQSRAPLASGQADQPSGETPIQARCP